VGCNELIDVADERFRHRRQAKSAQEGLVLTEAIDELQVDLDAWIRDYNFPAELKEKFGKFTESELAALKINSGEVVRHGACTLSMDARRPGLHRLHHGEGRAPHRGG
jgi:hypothetical protein